ncbi:MAG TPA: DUF692 domain-containing protein [Steroidobacteraceae bacterium]|nr:DUF692 domain-containing protein [Steroidobacteraceae bacterium]
MRAAAPITPELPSALLIPALPAGAGVSLKAQHYGDALHAGPQPAFLEVHAENYLHAGGPAHRYLTAIRAKHRLSIHGVGLSLGGPQPPSPLALQARRTLLQRYQPDEFSEHLAWSGLDGTYLNDLLPLAYTNESLARVCAHVQMTQEALGRRILLENPATYLGFADSNWSEPAFLSEVIRRTGCGLLLDVNNIVVSAANHRGDALDYLHGLPLRSVGEIHLAGHAVHEEPAGGQLLIDTHDRPVQPETWELYGAALQLTGAVPTLIEWDAELPDWTVLLQQAEQADRLLRGMKQQKAHATH